MRGGGGHGGFLMYSTLIGVAELARHLESKLGSPVESN